MLYESTPAHIEYLKAGASDPERKMIIPTSIPSDLVKAIDVTGLPDEEIVKLTQLQRDYKAYVRGVLESSFKFEDWVEHTTGERPDVKWRSYKVDGILKSS